MIFSHPAFKLISRIDLLCLRMTFNKHWCVSVVQQLWLSCPLCNLKAFDRYAVIYEVSDACLYWTRNIASSHVYSDLEWLFALWKTPTEPNAQWKIEKAASQLACIKIPHCPSSSSENLFFVVFVANWVDFSLSLGEDVLTSSVPLWLWQRALAKFGLTCCFACVSLKGDYLECVIHRNLPLMLGANFLFHFDLYVFYSLWISL